MVARAEDASSTAPSKLSDAYRHERLIPVYNDRFREVLYTNLKAHPDFPKKGIVFQDVFPLFHRPEDIDRMVESMADFVRTKYGSVDCIVGLDSRGFLIGPLLAIKLGCAFAPIRKAGKLPGEKRFAKYEKEYGVDVFEMSVDSLKAGDRVVIVDDLLATGGSLKAAKRLVTDSLADPLCCLVIVELGELDGGESVGIPCYSVLRT